MTQKNGKIYHVLGLEESILSKWLYYPKQSTDSVKSLSNYNDIIHNKKNSSNVYGNIKDHE